MLDKKICGYCLNAKSDPDGELTSDNDFSSLPVGICQNGYRLSIDTGYSHPTHICITKWNDNLAENVFIGYYVPKYCPECGRYLKENIKRKWY